MWVLACNQKCKNYIGNFNERKKIESHCCINDHKVWVYTGNQNWDIFQRLCVQKFDFSFLDGWGGERELQHHLFSSTIICNNGKHFWQQSIPTFIYIFIC